MALAIGSRIAKYRLDRRLGTGGMGEVFLAHDTHLDRLIAIKFLVSPGDDQARRRLLREARAVAGLDHPGICAIHEVGTDPVGGDFIVMQYIEGETLAARVKRGRLKPDEALAVGARIADALAAAHHRGIVHRDLKPQNIMLTPAGLPMLLDFGLAMHVAGTKAAADAPTISQVSDANLVAGTPGYMAPEQIRSEPADFRTDVFALGCVLYECLTGRRAFRGSTSAELMGQVLHVDPPAPSSLVPNIGAAHDALCARLLHKSPAERFQSAEEVLGAIRALTPSSQFPSGLTAVATAPRPRVSWRLTVALVAGAIVAIGAWQVYQGRPLSPPPADAAGWYDRGVESLRDGTYAGARKAFTAALNLFSRYPQAYYRLAEANTALEDEQGAQAALVKAGPLVRDRSGLTAEDELRFEAASRAASRDYNEAVNAYRKLADLKPSDAGRWLDVGRAEEAAGRTTAAMQTYLKAVGLDGQYAAARLRLGILQARAAKNDALASIDEAIRLYRLASNSEGEAEALLRKEAVIGVNDAEQSRRLLDTVDALSADGRFPAQHVRMQFERARLLFAAGAYADADTHAQAGVTEAMAASLPTQAATGLIDLGSGLMRLGKKHFDEADAQFKKAFDLATDRGNKRVAMRAKLQQASLRSSWDRPAEALAFAAEPLKYFSDANDVRIKLDAQNVLARAYEGLEQYDEASRLATDVLQFAESTGDQVRRGDALENLAGQMVNLGRLPEALTYRERLSDVHQSIKLESAFPKDLTLRAEVLIHLGRGADAEALLKDVEAGIDGGKPAYVERRAKVAVLRAELALSERRWADALRSAGPAATTPAAIAKPSDAELFARLLNEVALAEVGRSRTPATTIVAWLADASSPVDRREWAYWAALSLLVRHDSALAYRTAMDALNEEATQRNRELTWRLTAVAAQAARLVPGTSDAAVLADRAGTRANELSAAWGPVPGAARYFARPDLVWLRKNLYVSGRDFVVLRKDVR